MDSSPLSEMRSSRMDTSTRLPSLSYSAREAAYGLLLPVFFMVTYTWKSVPGCRPWLLLATVVV